MKKTCSLIHKAIATSLGLGYSPLAPGTMGALGGAAVALLVFHVSAYPNAVLLALTLLFTLLGIISSNALEGSWGKDPSRIVVDEVVGMWISVLFLPHNLVVLGASFILFRFFDIRKPLYIRKMESLKGGVGVMMDDVLAGIYTNVVMQISVFILQKIL